MLTPEQEKQIDEWLNTSITIRQPKSKQKFCNSIGISVPTLNARIKNPPKKNQGNIEADYSPDTFLENKSERIDKALVTACEKGNATALQTYYKLTKRLVEQSETKVKIGFDADEYARIDAEAERRSRDFREQNRTPSLQEKPILLSAKIREDTGCQSGSNTVQSLATSDTNS